MTRSRSRTCRRARLPARVGGARRPPRDPRRGDRAGDLRAGARERLLACRGQFYPERTWPSVLAAARAAHEDPRRSTPLERWLPGGRVDQKRRDALAMIEAMRAARIEHPGAAAGPVRVSAHQHVGPGAASHAAGAALRRRRPGRERPARRAAAARRRAALRARRAGALLRGLAEETASATGSRSAELVQRTALEFRGRTASTPIRHDAWLSEQGLDPRRLPHDDARGELRWTRPSRSPRSAATSRISSAR